VTAPQVMRRLDADVAIDNHWSLYDCASPKGVSVERDEHDHHNREYLEEQLAMEDRFREMGERLEGWR